MSRIDVAVGVVKDDLGRILIAKRKVDAHQGGLWEFPGGKFEPAEDDVQALNRELFEELNIKTLASSPLIKINFNYPECQVCLHVREVCDFEGEPVGCEGQEWKWVDIQSLNEYAFPEANKAILSAIKLGRHYAIIGGGDVQQVMHNLGVVLEQGIRLVQIRIKGLGGVDAEEVLTAVRDRCHKLGVAYLVNSQVPVQRSLDEGLHLTSFDLMGLSRRPESSGFVAASCHNLQELRKAEQLALDFAVLSPVMETVSHPGAKDLGWMQFSEWVDKVNIPVFALGGVGWQDYERALAHGAQGLSGISMYQR